MFYTRYLLSKGILRIHTGSPAAHRYYERLAGYVRALDPTRLVTWASSVTLRDRTLAYADVISFNDYSGWSQRALGRGAP